MSCAICEEMSQQVTMHTLASKDCTACVVCVSGYFTAAHGMETLRWESRAGLMR